MGEAMAVAQQMNIKAAGCLLIADKQTEPFILLGKDKFRRAYGVLAGKRQKVMTNAGETCLETPYQTALRETVEESRGYWDRDYLRAHSHPALVLERQQFMLFRAAVPLVDVEAIKAQKMPRFAPAWAAYREISDYAWISAKAIMQRPAHSIPTVDGRTVRVHKALAQELKTAEAMGWW